ncbi:MAG: hypothetical protein QM759_15460 [Terricaulis sp.]
MLWVDQAKYYGPDRRVANAFRLRDRRRENCAVSIPTLDNAVRQLRLQVIDVRGVGPQGMFMDRLRAVALLADNDGKAKSAQILNGLAHALETCAGKDMRPQIYEQLDRLHGAMAARL